MYSFIEMGRSGRATEVKVKGPLLVRIDLSPRPCLPLFFIRSKASGLRTRSGLHADLLGECLEQS